MSTFPLLSLPLELVVTVFTHLDIHTSLACRLISRSFKHLLDTSVDVQYGLELAISGMVDDSLSTWPTVTRLEQLQDYRRAWSTLALPPIQTIPMNQNVWELTGGVLAEALPRPRGRTSGPGGAHAIQFTRLPSPRRGLYLESWITDFGVDIRDFTFDPSQGLIAVIQNSPHSNDSAQRVQRIHMRSMRTGRPHPQATSCGFLDHDIGGLETTTPHGYSWRVKISGDYLACLSLINDHDFETLNCIRLWNWKNGALLLTLYGKKLQSIAFLSATQLLVAISDCDAHSDRLENYLAVYRFGPSLIVNDALPPDPEFILDLPECVSGVNLEMRDMSIYSDPSLPFEPCPRLKSSFYTGSSSRLFVLTLVMLASDHLWHAFNIFVPLATFQTFIQPKCPLDTSLSEGDTLPTTTKLGWRSWGVDGARMVQMSVFEPTWVCFVYGTRYVTSYRILQDDGELCTAVQIYDFNQSTLQLLRNDDGIEWRIRALRALSVPLGCYPDRQGTPGQTVSMGQTVIEPTNVTDKDIFTDAVESKLPFQIHSVNIDFKYRAVMLTEDHLVTVDTLNKLFGFFAI